jgi:hypothetical protein
MRSVAGWGAHSRSRRALMTGPSTRRWLVGQWRSLLSLQGEGEGGGPARGTGRGRRLRSRDRGACQGPKLRKATRGKGGAPCRTRVTSLALKARGRETEWRLKAPPSFPPSGYDDRRRESSLPMAGSLVGPAFSFLGAVAAILGGPGKGYGEGQMANRNWLTRNGLAKSGKFPL